MNNDNKEEHMIDFSSLSAEERDRLITFVRDEMGDDFIVNEEELNYADLSESQAQDIQRKLFGTLDRSRLGADIIRFSTKGFIEFLMAVMKPAFSSSQNSKSSGDGV